MVMRNTLSSRDEAALKEPGDEHSAGAHRQRLRDHRLDQAVSCLRLVLEKFNGRRGLRCCPPHEQLELKG